MREHSGSSFFFFFSSRRRHTRCSRDWSSDVCSSDLRSFILDIPPTEEELHHTNQAFRRAVRSEEHTSELQSRLHLVCRLLLEKKKNSPTHSRHRSLTSSYARHAAGCCARTLL